GVRARAVDSRQDPIWFRSGGQGYGRDGCRVPLPGEREAASFGFSPEDADKPWLPQPEWFAGYTVADQWADPGSILRLHAEALRLRRQLSRGAELSFVDVPGRPDIVAYRRGEVTNVTVFGPEPFTP